MTVFIISLITLLSMLMAIISAVRMVKHPGHRWVHYTFKPATMAGLIAILGMALHLKPESFYIRTTAAALLLSLIGDIFLMFRGRRYFIYGLGAFATAHVFYAISFYAIPLYHHYNPWIILILALIVFGNYAYLYNNLGKMKIPVFAYSCLILLMAILGTTVMGTLMVVPLGCLTFMGSDILIGVSHFKKYGKYDQIAILGLYFLAQYCFVITAYLYAQV